MRLETITIAGFRCFGSTPISTTLAEGVTAIVGPNAAGKTALLQGLSKLFGVSRAQRNVHRSDFHLPPDANPDDRTSRDLTIDVLISLPELVDGTATPETIAPAFRHMRIERSQKAPVCRLRLEARWEDDGTLEGEVSQDLFWVDTLEATPSDGQKHAVSASDRGLIQLYYTPASRDAGAQVRATAGALAARLLRAIEWSDATRTAVEAASETLAKAYEAEAGIKAIGEVLKHRWLDLHDEAVDTEPRLSLVSRRFEEVVNRVNVIFQRGPVGFERGVEALSDGQQSLFYFALAAAVFDLERSVVAQKAEGFRSDELHIPALTIFALEEPENHLSPYFLARIVRQIRSLVAHGAAQAIVTSHSPAVLSRVDPKEVRYCRCDSRTRASYVKGVKFPDDDIEASKFVRGAMLAFPELYFARFVLLVEGDSERVVLPRLAEVMSLLVDPAFVAIVPLGGRHVQHFWRLLRHLEIPFATLLDLDLGRDGGGFGRLKTVIEHLIAFGAPKEELLKMGGETPISDKDLDDMHNWQEPEHLKKLQDGILSLRDFGVFFSSPLDFDLAMLAAYPGAYKAIIPKKGGTKMTVEKAAEAALGTAGPGIKIYVDDLESLRATFPDYRYHFITHSKPATHLAALTHLTSETVLEKMPEVLRTVLEHVSDKVRRD